jgi:hypothetical protein
MSSRLAIALFVVLVSFAALGAERVDAPNGSQGDGWPSVSRFQDRAFVSPARPRPVQTELCQDLCLCPGDTTIEIVANSVCRTYSEESQKCEAAAYQECARKERRQNSNLYYCRTCI